MLSREPLYLLDSETSWVRWVPGDDSTLSPVSEALVEAPAASEGGPWQRQADDCLVWMMILALLLSLAQCVHVPSPHEALLSN